MWERPFRFAAGGGTIVIQSIQNVGGVQNGGARIRKAESACKR
jgi:hypothetical protein